MSVGATAEMPVRTLPARVVPTGGDGSGVGTIDQAAPSQCSISAFPVRLRPTAQALLDPKSTTPSRIDFADPVVAGVGTIVHAEPFQCAAIGLVPAKPLRLVDPTAHASFAPAALTASSFSSKNRTFGVATWLHRVPFHRSVSMILPSCRPGPSYEPTAHASDPVRPSTAVRTLENASWRVDGSTVGTIVHAAAANAGAAAASVSAPRTPATGSTRRFIGSPLEYTK